jgi:hypothetical protein
VDNYRVSGRWAPISEEPDFPDKTREKIKQLGLVTRNPNAPGLVTNPAGQARETQGQYFERLSDIAAEHEMFINEFCKAFYVKWTLEEYPAGKLGYLDFEKGNHQFISLMDNVTAALKTLHVDGDVQKAVIELKNKALGAKEVFADRVRHATPAEEQDAVKAYRAMVHRSQSMMVETSNLIKVLVLATHKLTKAVEQHMNAYKYYMTHQERIARFLSENIQDERLREDVKALHAKFKKAVEDTASCMTETFH